MLDWSLIIRFHGTVCYIWHLLEPTNPTWHRTVDVAWCSSDWLCCPPSRAAAAGTMCYGGKKFCSPSRTNWIHSGSQSRVETLLELLNDNFVMVVYLFFVRRCRRMFVLTRQPMVTTSSDNKNEKNISRFDHTSTFLLFFICVTNSSTVSNHLSSRVKNSTWSILCIVSSQCYAIRELIIVT